MIVSEIPSSVKTYLRAYCQLGSTSWLGLMIGGLIVGLILVRGRRTLANLADSVAVCRRHKSRLSRFFSGHSNDVVRAYSRAVRRAVTRVHRACRAKGQKRWLLAIDTTFQSKHSLKMESLIAYKEKAHGVPTGSHGFVVGLLIAPNGTRIPLPVEDFLTKKFAAALNEERKEREEEPIVRRTQLDLAAQLVRDARALLPQSVQLWVVADNFFEGGKLDHVCNELHVTYVTVLDRARLIGDPALDPTTAGESVAAYQKSLPDSEFRRVALPRGGEPWASYRRREVSTKKPGRRPERVYKVARRRLAANGLGERTVLFSWKRRRMKYNTHRANENLKVLVTNSISADTEVLLDAYAMRWQIELFFRELKSDLGLGHYQVLTFAGIRTHVHLVLTAFLFLEMERIGDAVHARPSVRTRQLAVDFEVAAREEEVQRLSRLARAPRRLAAWVMQVFLPRKVS